MHHALMAFTVSNTASNISLALLPFLVGLLALLVKINEKRNPRPKPTQTAVPIPPTTVLRPPKSLKRRGAESIGLVLLAFFLVGAAGLLAMGAAFSGNANTAVLGVGLGICLLVGAPVLVIIAIINTAKKHKR